MINYVKTPSDKKEKEAPKIEMREKPREPRLQFSRF